MSDFYVFQKSVGTQIAISDDKAGTKLPKSENGTWALLRSLNVRPGGGPLIGADSDEVIEDIKRDGYSLWPKGAAGNEK